MTAREISFVFDIDTFLLFAKIQIIKVAQIRKGENKLE